MDSRAIPILLASIAFLLFSMALILGSLVVFLLDVTPRIYPLAQGQGVSEAGVLVVVGLIVAVFGASVGIAGFAAISNGGSKANRSDSSAQ